MAEQSKSKKFISDLGVYTLGNFGSRIMTFLMVPVYTYFVEKPSDFGYYDLCMIICSLLFPVASLRLRDGAVRFLLDTGEDDVKQRTLVISSIFRVLLDSLLVWCLIAMTIRAIYGAIPFLWHSLLYLLSDSALSVEVQIARGLGKNKFFAAIGVITTILTVMFTIVFLACFKMGVEGIFISNILARIVAIGITEWYIGSVRRFLSWKIDVRQISKDILKFCVPLIPTALCWSLTNANGRFFIGYFLGLSFNGIFAIALRFGSVFNTISYIFGTAWQETAIKQYGKEGSELFFSQILNAYIVVLSFILVVGAFLFKAFFPMIIAPAYQDSINYVYLMGLSSMLYALASFFEMGYHCAKETKRTVSPIIWAAVINIIANFLVLVMGLYGICLASCIAYGFLMVYRWYDTKRYFRLHILRFAYVPIALALVSVVPFYVIPNMWASLGYALLALVLMVCFIPLEAKKLLVSKIRLIKH